MTKNYHTYLTDLEKRDLDHCWNCGATYPLDKAHVAAGKGLMKREIDRRAVVILCRRCHMLHVHDVRNLPSMKIDGEILPTISNGNCIWYLREFGEYDQDYLGEVFYGEVPEPVEPPQFWKVRKQQARGEFYD